MKDIDREVQDLLMGIINKREKACKGKNDDLLGILMESNSREIKEFGNKKSPGMSIKEVIVKNLTVSEDNSHLGTSV